MIYPLWESREALWMVTRGMVKDLVGWGNGKYVARVEEKGSA